MQILYGNERKSKILRFSHDSNCGQSSNSISDYLPNDLLIKQDPYPSKELLSLLGIEIASYNEVECGEVLNTTSVVSNDDAVNHSLKSNQSTSILNQVDVVSKDDKCLENSIERKNLDYANRIDTEIPPYKNRRQRSESSNSQSTSNSTSTSRSNSSSSTSSSSTTNFSSSTSSSRTSKKSSNSRQTEIPQNVKTVNMVPKEHKCLDSLENGHILTENTSNASTKFLLVDGKTYNLIAITNCH